MKRKLSMLFALALVAVTVFQAVEQKTKETHRQHPQAGKPLAAQWTPLQ
ncbi:MAG: hypothetical protein V8R80_11665 [Eubacterium sp.]